MLLKRLIISKMHPEYEIIRDVKFNLNGLNLIIDDTTNNLSDTGNNVGKTTFIKIIDLCLGARSVRSLYHDDDTKSDNEKIKKFLKDNKVEAQLEMLNENTSIVYKIRRQLYNKGNRYIDDVEYTYDDFLDKLKEIIFGSTEKYPRLRELMPKFVRVDNFTTDNMIRFLGNYSKNHQYDSVYQYLFKILDEKLINEKNELNTYRTEYSNKIKILESDSNITSLDILKQKQKVIENELESLIEDRKKLDYIKTYKNELNRKRNLTIQINDCEEELQLLEFGLELLNNNIDNLKKDKTNMDLNKIKKIYKETQIYIDKIEKNFEDVVEFHNNMIENRISFFNKQKVEKEKERKILIDKRDELLDEKKNITIDILDEGLLSDLNVLNSKIEKLSIQKGENNKAIKILEENLKNKQIIDNKINILKDSLNIEKINNNIELFNKFFTEYSQEMYGEKYLFAYNSNWEKQNGFPVQISNFNGIVGTGMKKGMIVAFDFAYLKYSNFKNIECPKFIIHDKLETTHINQLKTIFKICEEINGQYIVPILRERIKEIDQSIIKKATILELSQSKKLFKI